MTESSQTHASRAYQHLKSKFLSGAFMPGERILYGPIGKEIGVSATPVREAAGRLANEGLVELIPQLGAVVRKIGRTELIEIYEVRLALEPFAAALAAQRITVENLQRVDSAYEKMVQLAEQHKVSDREFADQQLSGLFDVADYEFHMAVIEATGNESLVRTAGQSHVLTRVFGIQRHRYDVESMRLTIADHFSILEAIRNGEDEKARLAAIEHIENGLKVSIAAMDQQPV